MDKINRSYKAFSLIFLVTGMFLLVTINIKANTNSNAILISPRLGAVLRTDPSAGPEQNSSNFLSTPIKISVGTDSPGRVFPSSWLDEENWVVGIVPSVLDNSPPIYLKIISAEKDTCSNYFFGMEMEQNPIYQNALVLNCLIPANVSPILYNLFVVFGNTSISIEAGLDSIFHVGSWQTPLNDEFIVSEVNCISIPWIYDARTSTTGQDILHSELKINPFTMLQVTDTHFSTTLDYILPENWRWQNDSVIIAPDFILLTGDLMESPSRDYDQYKLAYDQLTSLDLPLVLMAGNHDQYLLGPWRYFFGPLYSRTYFDDLMVLSFDSTMPLGSGTLSWIEHQVASQRSISPTSPVFMACHYPLMGSYFTSGWPAVANFMQTYQVDAIFSGHTHSDLNAEIGTLETYFYEYLLGTDLSLEDQFSAIKVNYSAPISDPQMIVTRSAGKNSGILLFDDVFPEIPNYSGYRKLNLVGNDVYNYTYDWDGDGQRDPFLSIPNGRYSASLQYDPNFGEINGGVTWSCYSNSTEEIVASAKITLPLAHEGYNWQLSSEDLANGAYIRAMVYNSSHAWYDVRVPLPRLQETSIYLSQQEILS